MQPPEMNYIHVIKGRLEMWQSVVKSKEIIDLRSHIKESQPLILDTPCNFDAMQQIQSSQDR